MNFFQKLALKTAMRLSGVETDNPLYRVFTESRYQGFDRVFGMSEQDDEKIIKEGYAKNSDVYAIVRKIVSNLSKVEWYAEVKTADGWEKADDTQWNDLMKQPNKLNTWKEMIDEYATYYLLLGHTFMNKSYATGFPGPAELSVLPGDKVDIVIGNYLEPIKGFELEELNNTFIEAERVLYQKMTNPVGTYEERLYGLSPIRAAWYVIQAGNNSWEANGSILKNRGASGILTNKADFPLDDEEIADIEKAWNKRNSGPDKFGKVAFGGTNIEYTPIGMSPADLKLIEMSIIPLRTLCSIYGVDSEIFNDTASSTYNNRQEAEKGLWQNAVLPLADTIKDGLNQNVSPELEGEIRICYSTENIGALQADKEKQAKTVTMLVNSGIISQNEAREMMGKETIEGNESYNELKRVVEKNTTNEENN